jgi:N-acetylglutamate synthase/N-acetylornithine aminotransferase
LLEIPLRGARLSVSLSTSFLLRLGAMVPMTIKKDMAKEALGAIATMRVSDDRVKKVTTQQLCQKFNLATFDENETINDYVLHLAMLSEEVKDGEIIVKMLQSLLHPFKQIVTRCVDYIYCRSDRAVEGSGGGIQGSTDIVAAGR